MRNDNVESFKSVWHFKDLLVVLAEKGYKDSNVVEAEAWEESDVL